MRGENYGVGWSLGLIYYIAINWTARDVQDDQQADWQPNQSSGPQLQSGRSMNI
jgi:hypothetical protein